MKKTTLILIMLLVAAVSSAATVGVMKFIESGGWGDGGKITIISDKRCQECNTAGLEGKIKGTFPNEEIVVLDYSDKSAKKLYDAEELGGLPALLIPKRLEKDENYSQIQKFTTPGIEYIIMKTGGRFDPEAEICDNKTDDNGNGKVDCEDPACKKDWLCMEKKDKPEVDVFVMSHCPYGTQIEKGLLPVWDALGDKVDMNIRFCDYAMHGKKEVDEQVRQYCIQDMSKKKFRKYLQCFLEDGKPGDKCLKKAGIDKNKLNSCIGKTDKKFNVTKMLNDKSTYKGRFPTFPVNADLAKKYGVRGSPTLVINGVTAKTGRSPKAILDAVCTGFKDRPAECDVEVDAANPSPGFGFKAGSAAASSGGCGS